MKRHAIRKIEVSADYLEISVSVLILAAVSFVALGLVKDLAAAFVSLFSGSVRFNYELFLREALTLIIGIEFVKMVTSHTVESTIEVLMVAIARRLLVHDTDIVELFIGIAAIALLFGVRKFLQIPPGEDN